MSEEAGDTTPLSLETIARKLDALAQSFDILRGEVENSRFRASGVHFASVQDAKAEMPSSVRRDCDFRRRSDRTSALPPTAAKPERSALLHDARRAARAWARTFEDIAERAILVTLAESIDELGHPETSFVLLAQQTCIRSDKLESAFNRLLAHGAITDLGPPKSNGYGHVEMRRFRLNYRPEQTAAKADPAQAPAGSERKQTAAQAWAATFDDGLGRRILSRLADAAGADWVVATSVATLAVAVGADPAIVSMALRDLELGGALTQASTHAEAPFEAPRLFRLHVPDQAEGGLMCRCARLVTGHPHRKAVLMALARHSDARGGSVAALRTIAVELEVETNTVRHHINELVRAGLIFRRDRTRPDGIGTTAEHVVLAGPRERTYAASIGWTGAPAGAAEEV